jgi:hypothetical protein
MQALSEVVRIPRCQLADQQPVWDLHHIALREVGAHLGTGPWDDDLCDIERLYLDGTGEFLVGELNGEIVAMGARQNRGVGLPRSAGWESILTTSGGASGDWNYASTI